MKRRSASRHLPPWGKWLGALSRRDEGGVSTLRSAAGALDGLDARAGAQGGGDVGQVPRVLHFDVEVDVEEVGVSVAHIDADDIAAGLADDGAGLAEHAGRIAHRGVQAGVRKGAALGFRRPLQIAP